MRQDDREAGEEDRRYRRGARRPTLYERDPGRVAKLGKERADAANALSTTEDERLTLIGDYEAAMAMS